MGHVTVEDMIMTRNVKSKQISVTDPCPSIMAEALQQLLLDTLAQHSIIKDTRSLVIPGQTDPAESHEAQITILGALNSLHSREVVADIVYKSMH